MIGSKPKTTEDDYPCIEYVTTEGFSHTQKTITSNVQSYRAPELSLHLFQMNIKEMRIIPSKYKVDLLDCSINELEYLHIPPNTVETLICYKNQLHTLHLEEGIEKIICTENPLKELKLPQSLKDINCDNTLVITNLEEYIKRGGSIHMMDRYR